MGMQLSQGKTFEKPAPGMYLGTIIDVVEMPNVQTQYGLKNKVRIHWVLAHLNGQLVIGKENQPIEAVGIYNGNTGPKAELTKRLNQILGFGAVPVLTDTEQLAQLVIGRSNLLVLVQSENPKNPQDPFVNVDGIGPLQPGMPAPPPIPQGYVRHALRPKTVTGPNGQPVQTYATPAAAAAAPAYPAAPGYGYPAPAPAAQPAAVNLTAGAPAPTANRPF